MKKLEAVLITGRTDKQGETLEIGKTSKEYFEHLSTVQMNQQDMSEINVKEGDTVKVETEYGSVAVKCKASREVDRGIIFMPYGPWTSLISPVDTEGISMPSFKGIKAKVYKASGERILTIQEIVEGYE